MYQQEQQPQQQQSTYRGSRRPQQELEAVAEVAVAEVAEVAVAEVVKKPKREVSEMRKLTTQLDAEVKKSESSRVKIAKLQKGIEEINGKIKAITELLAKQVSS